MLINLLLSTAVIGGIGYGGYKYYNSLGNYNDDDVFEDDFTDIDTLVQKVSKEFYRMQQENFKDQNLSKRELAIKQKSKAQLTQDLKAAKQGSLKAKRRIKAMIKSMLQDKNTNLGVNEDTIDNIIPFCRPNEMKNVDKFEILLYIAYNYLQNDMGKPCKGDGFAKVFKDYKLLTPVQRGSDMMYDFTSVRLNYVFTDLIQKYEITYNDKLEIVTQRIFERFKGFGVTDMLFDTNLDEVDVGLNGISKDSYEIIGSAKNLPYTYQSIWIMISGIKCRLSCIGFDSQDELVRVVNNIYKFGANKPLSKKTGYVISSMQNGNRCVVMRPPFANTFAFLARKPDSAPSVDPEILIRGNNTIIPLTIIKWTLTGERNLIITGDQGTGKTTILKAIIRFIRPWYSIRVQEKGAELNLPYAYPYRNILSIQETESVSMQEGLNMLKKSTGDVTILGEMAEPEQTNHGAQIAQRASKILVATNHSETTDSLLVSSANDLLDPKCGIYRDKTQAIELLAQLFHNDMHMAAKNDVRYIERFTEVIPVLGSKYPTEVDSEKYTHEDDEREYWIRQTDRKPYKLRQLFHFDDGEYVIDNLPSEDVQRKIKDHLSKEEIQEFEQDMEMLRKMIGVRNPLDGGIQSLGRLVLDDTQEMFRVWDEVDKGA